MLDTEAVLLIIDVQKGMDLKAWGPRSTPEAVSNIVKLLERWRNEERPLIHIKHRSALPDSVLRPGLETFEFKSEVKPLEGEKVIVKSTNSAFIDTELQDYLQSFSYKTLIIVGMTSDHCVSATARTASDLKYEVFLASDATACFGHVFQDRKLDAETVQAVTLASLNQEFATVLRTDELLQHLAKR